MAELATRDQYWDGYMRYDFFPNKYAETNMYRDPEQLYDYNRNVIKDFSSDKPLFPEEEAVRGTDGSRSEAALNLRYSGDRADAEDPYTPDRFLEMTQKDPRGWTGEQPWDEYRKNMWHRAQNYEYAFQNDSDNSVPSQGIHPNTMYRNIRQGIQPQVQAKFRNFGTSYDYQNHGGSIPTELSSNVDKTELQKNIGGEMNFDNPANVNYTNNLSRDFENQGFTRSTPSHQFNVAQYGMVFKTNACMPLKRQITHMDMGSGQSKMCEKTAQNRKEFAEAMSAMTSAKGRKNANHLKGEQFKNLESNQLTEMVRKGAPPQDILKAAGYTTNEIRWMTSHMGKNRTSGKMRNTQDVIQYVKLTGKAPPELRPWLLKKSSFILGNIGNNRREVVINPKLIQFLEDSTRSGKTIKDSNDMENVDMSIDVKKVNDIPIYVAKSGMLGNPRRTMNAGSVDVDEVINENFGSKLTHSYSNAFKSIRVRHRQEGVAESQDFNTPYDEKFYTNPGNDFKLTDRRTLALDENTFLDSEYKDRRARPIGEKYQRRLMDTSDFNDNIGEMNDF